MWTFGNLARSHSFHHRPHHFMHNRTDVSPAKKEAMMDAAVYKGAAVVTAGLVGGISAYKGLPEIKNFAGFDVLAGLGLSALEFWMLWQGKSGKGVAAVGGVSTGLLCHWAAVQGTIWGATKAKADMSTGSSDTVGTKGWDYDAHDETPSHRELPNAARNVPVAARRPQAAAANQGFDTSYYGMM
jgi:hypothetical protein